MKTSYDLVSVGGGLAGLTAAARAAELGARVAVVEKGDAPDYLCNSRVSGGVFHIAYQDVKMAEVELRHHAEAAAGQVADPELLEIMVTEARRAVDWLLSVGGQFVRGPRQAWVMAPPRAQVNRLDWAGRGPDLLLRRLTRRIAELGGTILLGTEAIELAMTGNRCTGLRVRRGTSEHLIRASAVVIADGGYQMNAQLFGEHIGPRPDAVFQRNARTSNGAGLRMALAVGAKATGLGRFYGHLLSRDAFANDDLWPFPQLDIPASVGIVVDRQGRRIFDEGLGGIYAANHIATLDDPLGTTIICNPQIWEMAGREALVPPNPNLEEAGGTIHRADTIDGIAEMAGIDPVGLKTTVEAYDAHIDSGRMKELSPQRTATKHSPVPIGSGPYIAIPICSGITNTMGGLMIDRHARVIGQDGSPIAGLYAAGAASGGLEGGPKAAYFGGLSRAGVFGMLAAEHAAAQISDTSGNAGKDARVLPVPAASAPQPLEKRYPLLYGIRRHGVKASYFLAAALAVAIAILGWPFLGAVVLLPSLILGTAALLLARTLTELISVIIDVLLPQ